MISKFCSKGILLFLTLFLSSCATLFAIGDASISVGHFKAGRIAENRGDYIEAIENYEKANNAYKQSDESIYISPQFAYTDSWGRASTRFNRELVWDAIKRVEPLTKEARQKLLAQTAQYTIKGLVKDIEDNSLANVVILFQPDFPNTKKPTNFITQTLI